MQGQRYRVKAGDSLSSIAAAHMGSARRWPVILAYNNRPDVVAATGHAIKDPDVIKDGQLLLIPPPHPAHAPYAGTGKHPLQATVPHIAATTKPAGQGPAHGHAATGASAHHGTDSHRTTVNSFPFKYKLDLIPKQTVEGPNYTATISFDGTVILWLDKQIPIAMLTNKGVEASARHEADTAFAKLVQSEKITWEPGSRKASYENMLTVNAHGAPPSLVSAGLAVTSDNPVPAMRFKFSTPVMKGKLGGHLFFAENFTATVDLRPKMNDPMNTRRFDPHLHPIPVPAVHPETWWQHAGHWAWDHKVEIGVGVVVTAVLVSNVLTAGTDTEADVPVGLWAARTLEAARAARLATQATRLVPAY